MRAYVDSEILIRHLRGKRKALKFLRKLASNPAYELWISALDRSEILSSMHMGEEENTLLFLSGFKTAPVDQVIADTAAGLYRQWNPTYGIGLGAAFLAATAIRTGGRIFSLNQMRYPMPEVSVEKAW
ncbi:MAG: PIN domain-containing protein [Gemmatimonadetes bacterium]|nr:PIN domain-containing protein [Gemmatimonadota bacterium]